MRALFVQQGLLKELKGASALPTTLSDEEKEDMLERAHNAIMLCLSDEVLREVPNETTALSLQLCFVFRMSEGTLVQNHIDEFIELISDLTNMDVKIDDEDQALILLWSLSHSFENFVGTMLYGREALPENRSWATKKNRRPVKKFRRLST
ncbi:hypothetical protein ACLB2K_072208 [Fragaria x ananassa]